MSQLQLCPQLRAEGKNGKSAENGRDCVAEVIFSEEQVTDEGRKEIFPNIHSWGKDAYQASV